MLAACVVTGTYPDAHFDRARTAQWLATSVDSLSNESVALLGQFAQRLLDADDAKARAETRMRELAAPRGRMAAAEMEELRSALERSQEVAARTAERAQDVFERGVERMQDEAERAVASAQQAYERAQDEAERAEAGHGLEQSQNMLRDAAQADHEAEIAHTEAADAAAAPIPVVSDAAGVARPDAHGVPPIVTDRTAAQHLASASGLEDLSDAALIRGSREAASHPGPVLAAAARKRVDRRGARQWRDVALPVLVLALAAVSVAASWAKRARRTCARALLPGRAADDDGAAGSLRAAMLCAE
ncbi:hypothetical protein KFE25_003426 [Diacronema lutheri]|uniref:Uncharacterized protein n=1 Tax=Diacronema lutheri TaxID=2081491 RepID=A0A8J6CEA5_DIALT|nr:hypothetical protein KFE25_003426 [Diacronema lutheri]